MSETHELTPPVLESIVAMTAEGQWPERAAGALGIPKAAFDKWVEQGLEDVAADTDTPQRELVERIYVADCQAEGQWFQGLRARIEATKFFAGYMAFMSRRWPERWVERKPEPASEARFEDEIRAFTAGAETARQMLEQQKA